MHQVIHLLLKLSFLLIRCAILSSFVFDHVLKLIKFLTKLIADFTDIAPRISHLVELVEVGHVDASELGVHPVRVVRGLDLVALTAGSYLDLRWIGGDPRKWSGHLRSI